MRSWAEPVPTVLVDLTVLSSPSKNRGIGRYVADLSRALFRAAPADLSIVGLSRLGWSGAADTVTDLEAVVAALSRGAPRMSHAAWAYHVRVALARAVKRVGPSLVHSGHPEATPLGRLGCPRVVTCHDLIELSYADRYLGWRDGWRPGRLRLDRRRYGEADHVIAVSRTTADDLVRVLGIAAARITVVHNGVDLERWSATPGPDDAAALARSGVGERPYALYVGGADWRKNPDAMCAAVAGVPDLLLVWAGGLAPGERAAVEDVARRRGIADRLKLLGYVDDATLIALRRAALAELFVSRAEGFGYPVIEAMACGCPVITSNCSSMREIAGDAAVLVDPEDHAAIVDALRMLESRSDERRRLRDAGLAHCRQFSLERMASETLDVYRASIGS